MGLWIDFLPVLHQTNQLSISQTEPYANHTFDQKPFLHIKALCAGIQRGAVLPGKPLRHRLLWEYHLRTVRGDSMCAGCLGESWDWSSKRKWLAQLIK